MMNWICKAKQHITYINKHNNNSKQTSDSKQVIHKHDMIFKRLYVYVCNISFCKNKNLTIHYACTCN